MQSCNHLLGLRALLVALLPLDVPQLHLESEGIRRDQKGTRGGSEGAPEEKSSSEGPQGSSRASRLRQLLCGPLLLEPRERAGREQLIDLLLDLLAHADLSLARGLAARDGLRVRLDLLKSHRERISEVLSLATPENVEREEEEEEDLQRKMEIE